MPQGKFEQNRRTASTRIWRFFSYRGALLSKPSTILNRANLNLDWESLPEFRAAHVVRMSTYRSTCHGGRGSEVIDSRNKAKTESQKSFS